MTSKKKKVFILLGMVALLVLTGVLNIVLSNVFNTDPVTDGGGNYGDFYASYKVERTNSREQAYIQYDAIISSPDSSAEAKANAEAAKLALTNAMDQELVLEGLIKSLGFDDAVVTSTTENINVIVKCTELTGTQATQIFELITTETKIPALNIRIIPSE